MKLGGDNFDLNPRPFASQLPSVDAGAAPSGFIVPQRSRGDYCYYPYSMNGLQQPEHF